MSRRPKRNTLRSKLANRVRRRLCSEHLESRWLLTGDIAIAPPFDQDFSHIDSPPASNNPGPDMESVFTLHSRPDADLVVYLDFDGHLTNGTAWNNSYGSDLLTPPFDLDGDQGSFNSTELQRIQNIWERVSEDFSPFDVDVTTEEPPLDWLIRSGGNDEHWGIRVAIGGSSNDWFGGGAGGVAYIGSFNWGSDTPTFVWPDSLGRSEKNIAEASSHEVGHTVGLGHDGFPGGSYYRGHGDWAPIMGVGYSRPIVQWSRGEYPGANNQQDDLQIISNNNGFDYRIDDHGDQAATATDLPLTFDVPGVIERTNDVDYFRLITGPGEIEIHADAFHRSPNLNIELTLFDSEGDVVDVSSPTGEMSASLVLNVPAGEYYARVDGVGEGDLATGFSDYASLGQYTLSGSLVNPGPAYISGFEPLDADRQEGNSGPTPFTFELTRTGNLGLISTVDYAVAGAGDSPADADDFGGSFPSGVVQFDPGQATAELTIYVNGDIQPEDDEEFIVTLSNPSQGTNLTATEAQGVIRDLDLLVTNVNNAGPGSLRAALLESNAQAGRNSIAFDIPDPSQPISLLDPLPLVIDSVIIDGTTQSGWSDTPLVRLEGSNSIQNALVVQADDTQIHALMLGGFDGDALQLLGDNIELTHSYVGADGAAAWTNSGVGVSVEGQGISITDNVISGNLLGGLQADGQVELRGNIIGADEQGAAAIANGGFGVKVSGSQSVISDNIISGNNGPALEVQGDGHLIRDNLIGTAADGVSLLSNDGNGLTFGLGAADTLTEDNLIAYNFGHGVQLLNTAGYGNVLRSNSLISNTRYGIELGNTGAEPVDPLDGDTGPNRLQNAPLLTSALLQANNSLRVQGELRSLPNTTIQVEIFASAVLGTHGVGEGATSLGEITVATNGQGFGIIDTFLPAQAVAVSQYITATATSSDGTSEFSSAVSVRNNDETPLLVIRDAGLIEGDAGESTMVFKLQLSNASSSLINADYQTVAGSASSGADFAPASGRVTFSPGQTEREIHVRVFGDTLDEDFETLFVELTGTANAQLANTIAQGTIVDDDEQASSRPTGASPRDTSEFLIGDVDVQIIFLESEGAENQETWTPQDLQRTSDNISEAVDWWQRLFDNQNSVHTLDLTTNFNVLDSPLSIDVEPSSLASSDEPLWLDQVLDRFGANTPDSAHSDLAALTDIFRTENGVDWAVTLLVVNNTGLGRSFANGTRSFASLGGPHLTILGDASPSEIAAQFGRVFYALNEAPNGDSYNDSSGYYNTPNANGFVDHPNPSGRVASIMAEQSLRETAFASLTSSPSSLVAVGWQDLDGDGIFDVLDVPLSLIGQGSWDADSEMYSFEGSSNAQALDNRNPYGNGNDITINRIRQLQYRINGGPWMTVALFDGPNVSINETFGPVPAFDTLELRTFDDRTGVASNIVVHNAQPTLNDIQDLSIDEDADPQTLPLSGITAGDDESQPLQITATSSDPDLLADPTVDYVSPSENGVLTLAPQLNQYGEAVVTVTVTDGGPDQNLQSTHDNNSVQRQFTVTINPVNDAPTVSPLQDVTMDEDTSSPPQSMTIGDVESPVQQLVVWAESSDQDLIRNDEITLSGLGAERTISVTPRPDAWGSATISIFVEDPDGGLTQQQFAVDVLPINDAPTISNIPNVNTAEDFPTSPLSFTIGDVETPAEELALSIDTSDPALAPISGVVVSGVGGNRTVRVTPKTDAFGSAVVTLAVDDGQGGTAEESFTVNVTPINDAPDILPIDDLVGEQDEVAGPFPFTVIDVDDTDLTIQVTSSNEDLIREEDILVEGDGQDRTISLTPQPLAFGVATIGITVIDPEGLEDSESFRLTINQGNQPPTITPVNDQTADEDTQIGPLGFVVGDGETPESNLAVTATSSNQDVVADAGLILEGVAANRSLTIAPVNNAFGQTEVTITVTDEGGLSASQTMTVTINPVNDAPSLDLVDDQTMAEDSTIQIPLLLSDPDHAADELLVEVTADDDGLLPAGSLTLQGDGGERTLLIEPADNAFGQTTLAVTVRDPDDASSSQDFSLTIEPVNDPPQTVGVISNGEVLGFQRISIDLPDPLFEDLDGDALQYALMHTDGSPVDWLALDDERVFGRPTNNDAGQHDLVVRATDPGGEAAEAAFQVEVLFNEFPWHNAADPVDINDDLVLTPQDIALQLSYLVLNGSGPLPVEGPNPNSLRLVDSTRDNSATAQDMAQTVAALFRLNQGDGEGEGEASPLEATALPAPELPASSFVGPEDLSATHEAADLVFGQRSSTDELLPIRRSSIDMLRELAAHYHRNDSEDRLRELALEIAEWWKEN